MNAINSLIDLKVIEKLNYLYPKNISDASSDEYVMFITITKRYDNFPNDIKKEVENEIQNSILSKIEFISVNMDEPLVKQRDSEDNVYEVSYFIELKKCDNSLSNEDVLMMLLLVYRSILLNDNSVESIHLPNSDSDIHDTRIKYPLLNTLYSISVIEEGYEYSMNQKRRVIKIQKYKK